MKSRIANKPSQWTLLLAGALTALLLSFTLLSSTASAQGYRYGIDSPGYYGGLSNLQLAPNHPLPRTPQTTIRVPIQTYQSYYGGNGYGGFGGVYGGYGYPYGYGYGYGGGLGLNYGYGGYSYGRPIGPGPIHWNPGFPMPPRF